MTPRLTALRQDNTHRLIPSRAADSTVLARLADKDSELPELFELDDATNDRLAGEAGLLPGISVHELLFGVSYAHVVNAAFTHADPRGSRFNGPERGAWYAAFDLETARAEIAAHKSQELEEVNWRERERFAFDDYLADFRGDFHDIRRDARFDQCLDPDSYAASQKLAGQLLEAGSAGIIYPSMRRRTGDCIACFRPALVTNVRKGEAVTITVENAQAPPTRGPRRRSR